MKILLNIAALIITIQFLPIQGFSQSNLKENSSKTQKSSWAHFSTGLFIKNKASKDKKNQIPLLKKALLHFYSSLKKSKEPGARLYYHIGDCYFLLRKYEKASTYLKKASKLNTSWFYPVYRLYAISVIKKDYTNAGLVLEEYIKKNHDSTKVIALLASHYLKKSRNIKKSEFYYQKLAELTKKIPVSNYYKKIAYFNLGYISFINGKTSKSIEYLKQALTYSSNDKKILYILTSIYYRQKNYDKILFYGKKFLAEVPNNKSVNAVVGRILYMKHFMDKDKIKLYEIIQYLKKGKSTKSYLGMTAFALYLELFQYNKQAKKVITYITMMRPKTAELKLAMTKIYLRENNLTRAFNELITAGIIFYKDKKYDRAIFCFKNASKFKKSIPGSFYYLGRIYEIQKNYKIATKYYEKALKLKETTDLLMHTGYLYGMQNKYNKAINFFNKAIKKDPKNSSPYFYIGLMSIWQKKYKKAEEQLEKAITITKKKKELYYYYFAIALERQKKINKAISSLELAVKVNPKSARSLNFLGYLYADNNMKLDRSLSLLKIALEIDPNNGAYVDSLGWVYYRKGNYKLALQNLLKAKKLLEKKPDPVVFDHIGDTYKKLGNIQNAVKYWKKAYKLNKDKTIRKKISKFKNKQ